MAHTPRVGISGWIYPPWRKTFYPAGLAQRRELEFASRQVTAIEVNGTFYSSPAPARFEEWYAATPGNFTFTVKANRYVTHIKKLHGVDEAVANFFASGVLALEDKLGAILWQLPPAVTFKPERWEDFLKLLPKDFKAAARLARRHGERLKGRAYVPRVTTNYRVRHAVEVRHESFNDPAFAALLKTYGVALVTADTAGKWPYFELPTADFVYVRLHGDVKLYESGYTDEALTLWARKIKAWSRTRDVFVFFDNDVKVQAPFNAVDLLRRVVKGYAPGAPVDERRAAGLKTPGPRLSADDSRWGRR